MKKFKLIPTITFLLVLSSYLILNLTFSDDSVEKSLSKAEVLQFKKLSEEEKKIVASLNQTDVATHIQIEDSSKAQIGDIPSPTYAKFKKVIIQKSSLASYLHSSVRLIMALFIFFALYIKFTKELNYKTTFSKILYEGVKLILLYSLFVIASTLISQYIFSNGKRPSIGFVFESIFYQFLKILQIGGLYAIFVSVFIYFHPQNIIRQQERAKKIKKRMES